MGTGLVAQCHHTPLRYYHLYDSNGGWSPAQQTRLIYGRKPVGGTAKLPVVSGRGPGKHGGACFL